MPAEFTDLIVDLFEAAKRAGYKVRPDLLTTYHEIRSNHRERGITRGDWLSRYASQYVDIDRLRQDFDRYLLGNLQKRRFSSLEYWVDHLLIADPHFGNENKNEENARAFATALEKLLPDLNIWRKDGRSWLITWRGNEFRIPHRDGLAYLELLVLSPNKELPPTLLENNSNRLPADASKVRFETNLEEGDTDSNDSTFDSSYKRSLENDPEALQEWLEMETDPVKRIDIERKIRETEQAFHPDPRRQPKFKSEYDRALKRVRKNIKTAIEKIREIDASLAAHLDACIQARNKKMAYIPTEGTPTWKL